MCSKKEGVEKETSYLMFIILFIFVVSFGCFCFKYAILGLTRKSFLNYILCFSKFVLGVIDWWNAATSV